MARGIGAISAGAVELRARVVLGALVEAAMTIAEKAASQQPFGEMLSPSSMTTGVVTRSSK